MGQNSPPEVHMSRHRLTLAALVGAGLLAAGALTGCATGTAPSSGSPSGTGTAASASPDAGSAAPTDGVEAAWVEAGRSVAVVTWGSSSCPPVAEAAAAADGTVSVTLGDSARTDCTRDMAPRATLVSLPAGVDSNAPLELTVEGVVEGRTTLPALASAPADAGQFAPSAGWVDEGLVAIVTYGSSGCPPTVESVSASGSDIAVRFATPPADRVCTMDIAPRVTLADVDGEVPEGAASVVLSGGGMESMDPIPVLGSR